MPKNKGRGSKPYGPVQSPSIFAAKWLSKFRKLEIDEPSPTFALTPFWYTQKYEDHFAHAFHFHLQATEIKVSASDFADDEEENPFAKASDAQMMVDMFLEWFKGIKYGVENESGRRTSWNRFPLEVRKKINDLLVHVEEAVEAGWWMVTDKGRQDVRKQIRHLDKRGIWPKDRS